MKRLLSVFLLLLYLGLWGDHLALLRDDQTQPLYVFPYRAALYPEADLQALKHGIPITSKEDACRILEDYFS